MDERTPAAGNRLAAALARVPDQPRWVDTRGMLLSGRAVVHAAPGSDLSRDGFLIAVPDASLASIVGAPSPDEIRNVVGLLRGDVNLLAQNEDAAVVVDALRNWKRRTAIIHVLPGVMKWEAEADPGARVFNRETAPALDHLADHLRHELLDALRGRTTARFVPGALPESGEIRCGSSVPMAAVWADRRPVAFCYPVWQTETHWDVSIDTLEEYRKRGLGARAARALIRHMRASGRAPVWGALDTNAASRALAARLGFIETAGLAVFTAE
jgi:RimJ/RimL family protein N-acetyltransferase